MRLDEHARTMASPPPLQMSADDLDGSAVRAARQGRRPATDSCRDVLGRFEATAPTRAPMHSARAFGPGGLPLPGMSESPPDGPPDFEAPEGRHRP